MQIVGTRNMSNSRNSSVLIILFACNVNAFGETLLCVVRINALQNDTLYFVHEKVHRSLELHICFISFMRNSVGVSYSVGSVAEGGKVLLFQVFQQVNCAARNRLLERLII